jgi:hypothetical protein
MGKRPAIVISIGSLLVFLRYQKLFFMARFQISGFGGQVSGTGDQGF